MEMSFFVKQEKLDETKKVIRSLNSLRFMGNPSPVGKEVYISISGEVNEMNQFSKYLSTIRSGKENAN
ncbi:MAG: hypothetical protein NTU63_02055 [Candidatus Pacearchaeota archaeon]|nr:hypothetical protein [Candidatus Pacearchaeota archaeon]